MKLPKIPMWVWIAGAALFLGGRKLAGPVAKTPAPAKVPEVDAVLTPATASQVAQAIVTALGGMGRKVVRPESWLFPLAVSQLETDLPPRSWRQLYNHNVGNVTGTGATPWYKNPHVTGNLRFRSFDSFVGGARAMLDAMKNAGALDAADKGDLPAFQQAMDAYNHGYATDTNLPLIVAALRGTIVADVA